MPREIPPRLPIGDAFQGAVVRVGENELLTLDAPPDADVIASGALMIRYGVRFLGKPHLSIVPGLVAVDYGQMFNGEEAWSFVLRRSNLYPRAEVFGYRNDGRDDMLTVKTLDVTLTPEVLVYANAAATTPLAKPTALITAGDALERIPPRVLEYLPRYESLDQWRKDAGS
ncbi:MAG: hypothetical protein HC828_20005 [Blastochloris sp.]|nr:hypothetical protein [Blastochloris sp.]